MAEEKKMGRPTDNPKGRPIHVRLDAEAVEDVLALLEGQHVVDGADEVGILRLRLFRHARS